MTIENKAIVTCDECGEETEAKQKSSSLGYLITMVPKGWIFLGSFHLRWYGPKKEKTMSISEEKDPHFCSRLCLELWLTDKIKSIK